MHSQSFPLQNLSVLDAEVKEWAKKVEAISSLDEKRRILSTLRKELAWAEVCLKRFILVHVLPQG